MKISVSARTCLFVFLFLPLLGICQLSNDIGVAAIDSPLTGFCGTSQAVYARVANYGINRVDSFTLNWSINGVLQTPVQKAMLLDTAKGIADDTVLVHIGQYSFAPGVPALIKAWTTLPNGLADAHAANDSASATRNPGRMNGLYTVNPALSGPGNFTSLADAITALNTYGVCGHTEIRIASGTYATAALTLTNITGAGPASTITIKGAGKDSTVLDVNITVPSVLTLNSSKYITLRDLAFINSTATATRIILMNNACNKISVINCLLKNPLVTANSEVGNAVTCSGNADSILVDSNTIRGGAFGVYLFGVSHAAFNRNMIIRNNNIAEVNSSGIYCATIYHGIEVVKNTISMNIVANVISKGIYLASCINMSDKPHVISQNRVLQFAQSGISLTNHIEGAVTPATQITNNLVLGSNIQYPGDIAGIRIQTSAGTYRALVYHNTVIVKNNQPLLVPANESFAALYLSGSTNTQVKNNIFYAAGGTVLPVNITSALAAGYLNNNVYYNTNPAGNIIRRPNNLFYQAANYNSLQAGGDSSQLVYPPFIDTAAGDYRLKHGCFLTAPSDTIVTTDLLDSLRKPHPAPGAFESRPVQNDLSIAQFITPVLQSGLIMPGLQSLTYSVFNSGSNAINSYRAAYRVNQNVPVVMSITDTLKPCGVDTIVFSGANQLNVQASQLVTCYTYDPNQQMDNDRSGDTLRQGLYASLSGVYAVGGSNPDFLTPQDAALALKERGIRGHVQFSISPGTYNGQLKITGPVKGLCDTATVTFDGVSADSVLLSASSSNSGTVWIDQLSYITIRNLGIENLLAGAGVLIYAPVASVVSKCTISNCNISLNMPNPTGSAGTGIFVTGSNALYLAASVCDSLTIEENHIYKAGLGIAITGQNDTLKNAGIVIRNNSLSGLTTTGMHISKINNPVTIDGNDIAIKTVSMTTVGIYFLDNVSVNNTVPHRIVKNRIVNFQFMGIQVSNSGTAATYPFLIANNELISGALTYLRSGIQVNQSSVLVKGRVLYNTVYLRGVSAGASAYLGSYSGPIEIKNNIFAVTTGASYPLNITGANSGNQVNYNVYNNTVSPTLVMRQNVSYTAANYKAATAGGDSSYHVKPPFYSTDSLAFNLALLHKCVTKATYIADVRSDINGDQRDSISTPGARETFIASNSLHLEDVLLSGALPTPLQGLYDVKYVVRNIGDNVVNQYQAAYTFNNRPEVNQVQYASMQPCATDTVVFTGSSQVNIRAINQLKVYTSAPNGFADANSSNDTLYREYSPVLNGTYTIGSQPDDDFSTFQQAATLLRLRGVSGPVIFRVQPGAYTDTVALRGPIAGLGFANPITFDGGSANLVNLTASTKGPVFLINRLNHIRIRNITINNQDTGIGIAIAGEPDRKTGSGSMITGCRINMPVLTGATGGGTAIRVSGTANGTGTAKAWIDTLVADSNYIRGGSYGIACYGGANNSYNYNVRITRNTIDSSRVCGINVMDIYNPILISQNNITMIPGLVANSGISFFDYKVRQGEIHVIERNRVDQFGSTGISCVSGRNVLGSAGEILIANNIVISADSSAGAFTGRGGISVGQYMSLGNDGMQTAYVYHNTVVMRGGDRSYGNAAFHNSSNSASTQVYNNIFAVLSGKYLAASFFDVAQHGSNVYYVRNATPGTVILETDGRNSYPRDLYNSNNSFNPLQEPVFKNMNGAKPDVQLKRGCILIASYGNKIPATDFWGKARHPWQPTVGAIEQVDANLTTLGLSRFAAPVATGTQYFGFAVQNTSTDTITSYQGSYILNNAPAVTLTKTANIKRCEIDSIVFTGSNVPAITAVNDFTVYTAMPGTYTADDTLGRRIHAALSGVYTVGVGTGTDFQSFAQVRTALESGLAGPVKFMVQPGIYKEWMELQGPIAGADSINSISFEGVNPNTCVLQPDTSVTVFKVGNIPNINISKLGIVSSTNGIVFQDVASSWNTYPKTANIKVKGCIINTSGSYGIDIGNTGSHLYDSVLIEGNKINGSNYGIHVQGEGKPGVNRYSVIRNNVIENCIGRGIGLYKFCSKANVTNNTVSLGGHSTGGIVINYNSGPYSNIAYDTSYVTGNKIYKFGAVGIQAVISGDYNKGEIIISNNLIVSPKQGLYTGEYGISARVWGWNSKMRIYHNTVVMQGASTDVNHAAIRIEASEYDLRNNILAVYNGAYLPLSVFSYKYNGANYNLYHNSSPSSPHRLVGYANFSYHDSSNFKDRSMGGDSSFTLAPPFVNKDTFPGDFSLAHYNNIPFGVNLGSYVPVDIYNRTRAIRPRVGAFEFDDPLPVKLLEFAGTELGGNALLHWKTSQEKNVAYFEVYGSDDDDVNYNSLGGKIRAKGNSNSISSYHFTEERAFAKVSARYYRLRSVDLDGSESWSNTAVVSIKAGSKELVVSPNPFNNHIVVYAGVEEATALTITDVQGRVVFERILSPENGTIQIETPEELKTGIYFLHVKNSSTNVTRKLVKN